MELRSIRKSELIKISELLYKRLILQYAISLFKSNKRLRFI